jgi:hypothetical protein
MAKIAEKFVLKQITDYLSAKRVFHVRLNTAAIRAEHNGKRRFFRAHSLGPGTADILALPAGAEPVWIETKGEGGRQTMEQKLFASWVETYGHRYIVCHSIDDLEGLL